MSNTLARDKDAKPALDAAAEALAMLLVAHVDEIILTNIGYGRKEPKEDRGVEV